MIRNVCTTNTAESTAMPKECANDFIKAMKIGYYREFYKQGLITADELDTLLEMQNAKIECTQNEIPNAA